MATFTTRRDPLVTCPFNPAHQMKQGRLQIHITKCRKAYPEKDLKACPFSAEHMVPSGDLLHHMHICPLNTTVERFLTVSEASKPSGDVSVPPYRSEDPPEMEENWDEDASVAATLEDKIAVPSVPPIFMNVQRMLPAERRHYYNSLHAKVDEMVPQSMIPKVLDSTPRTLPIPRQPRSEPKICLPRALPVAEQDSDSDEGSDDDAHVRQMPMGQTISLAKAASRAPSEDYHSDPDKSMNLLGCGRGRPLFRK